MNSDSPLWDINVRVRHIQNTHAPAGNPCVQSNIIYLLTNIILSFAITSLATTRHTRHYIHYQLVCKQSCLWCTAFTCKHHVGKLIQSWFKNTIFILKSPADCVQHLCTGKENPSQMTVMKNMLFIITQCNNLLFRRYIIIYIHIFNSLKVMHPNTSCSCYSALKICYNTPTQGHEPAKRKSGTSLRVNLLPSRCVFKLNTSFRPLSPLTSQWLCNWTLR